MPINMRRPRITFISSTVTFSHGRACGLLKGSGKLASVYWFVSLTSKSHTSGVKIHLVEMEG